jgi:hypothetical protein
MKTHKKKIATAVALVTGLLAFAAFASVAPVDANACYFGPAWACK